MEKENKNQTRKSNYPRNLKRLHCNRPVAVKSAGIFSDIRFPNVIDSVMKGVLQNWLTFKERIV